MTFATELFWIFVTVGLVLVGIEVFVPGGIIGTFGVIALLGAAITSFFAFGAEGGGLASVALLLGGGALLLIWLKVFPRTAFGRRLSLNKDGRSFKSADPANQGLLGLQGVAHSELRPSGIAMINGQRVDVVAETGFIDRGSQIRVVMVEGNRIVVRSLATK